MKNITIYGKNDCRDCEAAKLFFETNEIPFEYKNISENTDDRTFLINQGHKAVPQFYFEGDLVIDGGWKAMQHIDVKELKEKLF
jgi:glutaredoxin